MYGNHGRIGLLVPSCNTVVEREYNMALPEGYATLADRMWMQGGGVSGLARMLEDVEKSSRLLATAQIGVAVFACTSGSFMNGVEGEAMLQTSIRVHAGAPPVTTSAAFVEALRYLGASRVAVATPYIPEINELEQQYLVANGFSVVSIQGMVTPGFDQVDPYGSGRADRESVLQFVLNMDYATADAIVISCTNFPTFDIIAEVERRTGLPVVTSNQSTLWKALEALGFRGAIHGFGRLLECGFGGEGAHDS